MWISENRCFNTFEVEDSKNVINYEKYKYLQVGVQTDKRHCSRKRCLIKWTLRSIYCPYGHVAWNCERYYMSASSSECVISTYISHRKRTSHRGWHVFDLTLFLLLFMLLLKKSCTSMTPSHSVSCDFARSLSCRSASSIRPIATQCRQRTQMQISWP